MQKIGKFGPIYDLKPCFKKEEILEYKQMNEPFRVLSLGCKTCGRFNVGEPGDYLVRKANYEFIVVPKEEFERNYEKIENNVPVHKVDVEAELKKYGYR